MRVYIAARFKRKENRLEIEQLCRAVRASGMQDFCFIRDLENYQKTFDNPKDLWEKSLLELAKSDSFLMDVSDCPTGGRIAEAGIAYALKKPIFVIARNGVKVKDVFLGLADCVMYYSDLDEVTLQLKRYLSDRRKIS
jgi:nucleoside 2-deoxyribosyltransferase